MIVPDRCGTCRRCIDACPTQALSAPYQMDARLCIAYLTIEHKGAIAEDLMEGMGRQVFGCDICQDVCPWNLEIVLGNGRAQPAAEPRPQELSRARSFVNPALESLAAMDEAEFGGAIQRIAGA